VAYTLSRKAEEDLIEIYMEGVALFGVGQADKYHGKIEVMLNLLSENPRIAHERLQITPTVRIHPFRSHLMIYTVDSDDNIFIIRIRHAHEDWRGNPL